MTRIFSRIGLIAIISWVTACDESSSDFVQPQYLVQLATVEASNQGSRHEFVGRIHARLSVDLAFQVGGQLVESPLNEGQLIKAGDLVARLDREDFRRAEREAIVRHQQARADLKRQQTLFDRNIAAQATLENAQTIYDLSNVALEVARRNLEYATLSAPFDGLVSRRLIDTFTIISPGQPIIRLLDIGELRVAIPISEDLVATFDEDDVALIEARFAFLPEQTFSLEFRELISEPDVASQTYHAILALPDDIPANIFPGMTVTVTAQLKPFDDVASGSFQIPIGALARAADRSPFVWVYNEELGTVDRRSVELSEIQHERVVVISGLSSGERIVTAGVSTLQSGMSVRPLNGSQPNSRREQ